MNDQNIPLSPRHERFVLEYLKDGNATQAYIRAGFSPRGAQPSASRLLRQPHIEAAIAAGQQRIAAALEVSVERLGREYAKIAFASVDDFVSVEADGRLRVDLEKASRAQREGIVELKIANHSKPEQTVTLKLGKLQALAALTSRIGLFAKQPKPEPAPVNRERYEMAIATLGDELWEAKEHLCDAEEERDEARAALAAAHAALAAAGLDVPVADPNVSPSPRDGGEKVPSASEADEGLPGARSNAVAAETPQSPSSALRAPSSRRRGEKEDYSDPDALAPPEESPPIVQKGLGPPDPPQPKQAPQSPPQPHVAGAGNGTIFWNTARQPPSGPSWHDIIRNSRFPGQWDVADAFALLPPRDGMIAP